MWQEYRIPCGKEQQLTIIRALRKWILRQEKNHLVTGFAFNLYYNNPLERDELRIRFEYANTENDVVIERRLQVKVRDFLPGYTIERRVWNGGTTPENVLRAYESGSRCAFLIWDLIDSGRLQEAWVSNYYPLTINTTDQFNFQESVAHGLMNSLGIDKSPNELLINLFLIITVTKPQPNRTTELVSSLSRGV